MEATRWSREADLMLAIGSSLVVTPAADLPRTAKAPRCPAGDHQPRPNAARSHRRRRPHRLIGRTLTAIDALDVFHLAHTTSCTRFDRSSLP